MLTASAAYLLYEAQEIGATPTIRASLLQYNSSGVLQETVDITDDIEQAGTVTMEAPVDFSDLVAGNHSGLILNNRQGSFVDDVWVPAPKYSPNKSSFIFNLYGEVNLTLFVQSINSKSIDYTGDQIILSDWSNIQLKIELGWATGGWFEAGFGEYAWLEDDYTDFLTIFLGKVEKWGPVLRSVGDEGEPDPLTVEIYAVDWIMDCLKTRVALPDEDGVSKPLTYGEFLVAGENVDGWTPVPMIKEATFETGDLTELDHVEDSGGGTAVAVVTPGLAETGSYGMRCISTGASQSHYGELSLATQSQIFITGIIRFTSIPDTLHLKDMIFLSIVNAAGTYIAKFYFDTDGTLWTQMRVSGEPKSCDWNILAYENVPLTFALWYNSGVVLRGGYRLWINGAVVYDRVVDTQGDEPLTVRCGVVTGATSEAWTIDFDDLRLYDTYFDFAFQAQGYPFDSIGEVYIDNVAQPAVKTILAPDDSYLTQTVTTYPEYGIVTIIATKAGVIYPNWRVEGDVSFRVIENAGGRHALEMIELLLAEAGLTSLIDADSLAAAYLAVPDDILTGARFEGSGSLQRTVGLKDYSAYGMTIADCIKEICSRMMYWFFMEGGLIKIVPYTGVAPADPADLALDGSSLFEASPVIDFSQVRNFVAATYGWYERNNALYYIAGTPVAGGDGVELDFTWQSPVASESRALVVAKADLLNIFSSPQEIMDPVRTHLIGARVELMKDVVSIDDEILSDAAINYWINRKEIDLDSEEFQVTLQPLRILGEI